MRIFQIKNNNLNLKDTYLDLHGLQRNEAINIVRLRLRQIQDDLNQGIVVPLTGDGHNHVVKIVCGKGTHSNGRAVLKFAVPEYL
jgi:DNA-nicking Smr family endonuclease